MADDQALIAHLLRRTGFGPHPGQVAALAPAGYAAALDAVLAAAPLAVDLPGVRAEAGAAEEVGDERLVVGHGRSMEMGR